jgi:hypothetical protein
MRGIGYALLVVLGFAVMWLGAYIDATYMQ